MLTLLTADLQVLGNLLTHRAGRRLLIGSLLSLGFLWIVADAFGNLVAADPDLLWADEPQDFVTLPRLFAMALSPGLLLATWFSFSGGPRHLFELPQLHLWLSSPVSVTKVLLATWLRFSFLVLLWSCAICGPMAQYLGAAYHQRLSWPQIALAVAVMVLPTTALLLGIQVVLLRFFSGRWTRILFGSLSAVGSLSFSLLLLFGALGREGAAGNVLGAARGVRRFPLLIDLPANLLSEMAEGRFVGGTWLKVGLLLLGAAAGLSLLSLLYRSSWTNAQRALGTLRRRSGVARAWPASAVAVVFRKEVAQLLHQPGQLLGLLLSTLFVVVLAGSRLIDRTLTSSEMLPAADRTVFLLLATWLIAQITILPGAVMRMALLDGPQWPLYVGAPASRRAILFGKLGLVVTLQAWPALIAAAVGLIRLEADLMTLVAFATLVPAGVIWTSAVTAWAGTLPLLIRPSPDRSPLLALVAISLAIAVTVLTAVPGTLGWFWLSEHGMGRGPLAAMSPEAARWTLGLGAWALSLVSSTFLLLLAGQQMRWLTRPKR